MRTFPFLAVGLLVSLTQAAGQVSVELSTEQPQFLRDESLRVTVRILNRSGQKIEFGKEPDWLTFAMEKREGLSVAREGEAPAGEPFTLESAEVATRTVDLMPYFDLGEPGRYLVTATVRIAAWNREVTSRPREFEIVRGAKIWEEAFGVPTASGAPETRKYSLVQAHTHKTLHLYARVSDEHDQRVFKVLALGPMVSFSRPETQLDRMSQLHLLFQNGARSFAYATVSPDGELKARQTHDYAQTRPTLRMEKDGKIVVAGGLRRASSSDLPGREDGSSTNAPPLSKP